MNEPLHQEQHAQVQVEDQLTFRRVCLSTLSAGHYTGYGMVSPYSTLVHMVRRRYSTCNKASLQILSKLFPQTTWDLNDDENRDQSNREYVEKEGLGELNQAWRRMRMGFGAFGIGGVFLSLWSVYLFGKPGVNEHGMKVMDQFSSLPVVQQYIARTWLAVNNFQRYIQEPSSQKLLPDPLQAPYIQPPYTLILEIKDVLIRPERTYETGWRFKKRPGVDFFLSECAKYFEIVVHTGEQGIALFPLIDALDPSGYIMYRLVQDSTYFFCSHYVKDLDSLNRDLRRVVVIDWEKNSTKLYQSNSLSIPRWSGNNDDTTLYDLVSFLSVLGSIEVDDVREVLQYYNQFNNPFEYLARIGAI